MRIARDKYVRDLELRMGNGIVTMGLFDFLLRPDSLDLQRVTALALYCAYGICTVYCRT